MKKFELYYPVKPFFITQKFGETSFNDYYKKNGITFNGHNGHDLVAHHGDPIYASHDGLAYYEVDSAQGHGVVVITKDKYEYKGSMVYFKTIYWHMIDGSKELNFKSPFYDVRDVANAKEVKAGDIIGYADSTGLSTGDHLHFALKPVNKIGSAYINFEQDNGYFGAIDQTPYYNGKYAKEITIAKPPRISFPNNLRFGMENDEVFLLQKCLKRLGYFTVNPTGYYGSKTMQAVLEFQIEGGLVTFGIETLFGHFFGPKSRALLEKYINEYE